jgi:uracil-DNA glycosylase family 4
VDARERLRRYLEQRRELGESEFVLDALSVEDVMKVVGLRGSSVAATPARPAAKKAAPDAGSPAAEPLPRQDPPAAAASPAVPPPEPEVRFNPAATTDWRSALRSVAPADQVAPAAPATNQSAALPDWLTNLGIPTGIEAGRLRTSELAPAIAMLPTLADLALHVGGCERCALHKSAKQAVPGVGPARADVLCVGEAPGATEDEQGLPFVGEAGQLLTKILGAIQLSRDEVFICNVLKHRPPGNRDPLPDEVAACQPYLLRQIELVRPKVILALGRFAAQTLLQTTIGIGQLRGQLHVYHGVPLIVTYHPAALLRNESWKRPTWDDVKLARRVLDAARAHTGDAAGEATGPSDHAPSV